MMTCHFFNERFFILLHIMRYVTLAHYLCPEQHLPPSLLLPDYLPPVSDCTHPTGSHFTRYYKTGVAHHSGWPLLLTTLPWELLDLFYGFWFSNSDLHYSLHESFCTGIRSVASVKKFPPSLVYRKLKNI